MSRNERGHDLLGVDVVAGDEERGPTPDAAAQLAAAGEVVGVEAC
jgi:hypothetical protein